MLISNLRLVIFCCDFLLSQNMKMYSFYLFNDIQINKQKSELLYRPKKKNVNLTKEIPIQFGSQVIKVKPIEEREAIRILGCWFNTYNNPRYVKNQIREEIRIINEKILK